MQQWMRPGVKLIEMCEMLENTARTLVEANGLKAGQSILHMYTLHCKYTYNMYS